MRQTIKNLLFELVFPHSCVVCRAEGRLLCESCETALKIHNSVICPVCANRVPQRTPQEWKCPTRHAHSSLAFVMYATPYESAAARQLVRALKYRGVHSVAPILARYCADAMRAYDFENFIVTSVPLHPRKHRSRGFNQSEVMARLIAEACALRYCDTIVKIKNTTSQTELTIKERASNIKDAFAFNHAHAITNRNILIVDDVCTSGATLQECARVLKTNGAKKVGAIVFAR